MSHCTVVDWNNYMREVCTITISRNQQLQIGGPGKIVEIDKSMFSKRKNNAGRILPQQWIFEGICRETKETFLIQVPNRTKETLSTAIRQYIKVGTTIYSDCWRGYDTDELTREGYTHSTVNYSNNFVDPVTGVHTQHIERVWGSAKWRNKKHRGTRRHHLESYLAEFIWRQNIKGEPFDNIMKNISENWSSKIEF
ncbi:DDE Tnp IS1595 domain-containing protein [Aphis craccivora]|uniref:DDE Tnp IS1595 domain-containing protein n=1 Tax=Aphis craccivora TaxID=307492 RepID=A0A6G0XTG0_APHCR|nr:DDE Tnp IS1595 domain-containing protein [Aphis craccivora]